MFIKKTLGYNCIIIGQRLLAFITYKYSSNTTICTYKFKASTYFIRDWKRECLFCADETSPINIKIILINNIDKKM